LKRQLIIAGLFLAVAILAAVVVWRVAPGVLGDTGGGNPTPTPAQTVVVTPSPSAIPDDGPSTTPPTTPDISAQMNAFLHQVEPLISLSGKGMYELGQVTAPAEPGPGASDAIQYVIDNRTDVLQRLGSLTAPDDQARSCLSAFEKAMTSALAADGYYLDWAKGTGDKGAAGPDSIAAGNWKAQFVDTYNSLAAQYGNGMRHDWQTTDL
jgi:hypothetical protein